MARNPSLDLDLLRATLDEVRAPWRMASTPMTELVEDEREWRLGVPPPPASARPLPAASVAAATSDELPARFDVRDVDGVDYDTPVKDQGACGSCVAFGTAAAMEVTYRRTGLTTEPLDLSEAHLFYCHARDEGRTCGTGWYPERALVAARSKGVTTEDKYPYVAGDQDGSGLAPDWQDSLATVTDFEMVTGDPLAMKRAIVERGAVVACLHVYQDFFSYGGGVYTHVTGEHAGGHCVLLVGYDDDEGCWLGRNSWGTGWGEGGYFRIAYGECLIEGYESAAVTDVVLSGPAPEPTEPPEWPGRYLRYPPLTVGDDVRQWQERMLERGHDLDADGQYGPASRDACRLLQEEHGLWADGVVGPLTWQATFS
ncbi:C1 family peptidase [Vallicoccus soli]|uniref:Peptidase n=1 Tax=Vallicoccus soli TaxID=2339232 RepID=A0A3A3Z6P3_9ACTN|nr:C1 family peptidase [Vallicoccus soli]RJK96375.1 peptidase [Vallicoccus soli]